MDSLISQIQTLYSQADDESRRKIQEDIRDLQNSFDTEWEMVVRLATGVSPFPPLHLSKN